jgi:2,3-bisphosphoglycerate-dependent phosphoglycerate mutase
MTAKIKVDFEKIKKAAIASLKKPGASRQLLPKEESKEQPTIYLFRHTETDDNFKRIFSGRRDSHLTPRGKQQAEKLAKKLKDKKINLFIISPLSRCRQTVAPIIKYHPQAEMEEEKLLLERDYGDLTGKSKEKLMAENWEKAILYRRSYDVPPPGGETLQEVQEKRVYPFCQQLKKRIKKEKINIALCCTNNTMRLMRMFFEDLSITAMLTLENPFTDYVAYVVK